MTRAEYLESIQEGAFLGTTPDDALGLDPDRTLRDTPKVIEQLKIAHLRYCNEVARVLGFPEQICREYTSTLPESHGRVIYLY